MWTNGVRFALIVQAALSEAAIPRLVHARWISDGFNVKRLLDSDGCVSVKDKIFKCSRISPELQVCMQFDSRFRRKEVTETDTLAATIRMSMS